MSFELVVRYSEIFVLENHHAAATGGILHKNNLVSDLVGGGGMLGGRGGVEDSGTAGDFFYGRRIVAERVKKALQLRGRIRRQVLQQAAAQRLQVSFVGLLLIRILFPTCTLRMEPRLPSSRPLACRRAGCRAGDRPFFTDTLPAPKARQCGNFSHTRVKRFQGGEIFNAPKAGEAGADKVR